MAHFIISVNLLLFDPESEGAKLLCFPPQALLPPRYRIQASLTCGPTSDALRTSKQETLIGWAHRPQDEIWLRYSAKSSKATGEKPTVTIEHINQILETSPLSRSWLPTSSWTEDQIAQRHARHRNIAGHEIVVKQEAITRHPTDLITHFTIQASCSETELVQWFTETLVESFPQEFRSIDFVGSGDYEITTSDATAVKNHANIEWNLKSHPNAIPLLGQFFDELHPWMIGPLELCESLVASLASFDVAIYPLLTDSGGKAFLALVTIPKAVVIIPEAQRLAAPYLVPRNASTEQQYWGKHPEDEFQFGAHSMRLLTRRRHNVLVSEGRLDAAESDWRPLIADNYAELLGIEPDAMLLTNIQAFYWDREQSQVRERYERLSDDLDLKERIWQAHSLMWRSYNWRQGDLDFVYNRFFREF